jgi:hypothetical protein
MAGELILIIEDDGKNLKLVRDLLQVKGYRTLEAGAAELGIGLARQHRPHLSLMDIQLPGMDGSGPRPAQDCPHDGEDSGDRAHRLRYEGRPPAFPVGWFRRLSCEAD